MEPILEMIKTLTGINSPSGDTEEAIQFVEKYAKDLGYQTTLTNKGALLITVPGKNDEVQRCITAHVDTLGAMVKEIKEDGRLAIELIGGFTYNAIEGEYCQIKTDAGQIYTGTICLHETSVHVYRNNHEIPRDQKHMEIRIDEVTTSEEDTKSLGISVGDFVSFDPRTVITSSGFIKSRHLDDKASVAMILQLLKKLKEEQIILPHTTQFYISNNEEIGYGANASIDSKIKEYIALDGVEAAGQGEDTDKHALAIGKGSPGVLHGTKMYLIQDEGGQVQLAHSISAGLDYPGIGPEHSYYHDIGRVTFENASDTQAMNALINFTKHEGIIPAIESAHALSYVERLAPTMSKEDIIVVTISGRGDKDMETIRQYMAERGLANG
ncbi:TPA: M20/M25/M40 family metallo-hydrolase [Staphylococcus aureus]|nr:M20/M25/M40 family metallo-hydrolase [Staphylococcus aureus]HDE0232909.1 M20/M25/M40 family metallo-hydrolase [Staphylococcus aureus]